MSFLNVNQVNTAGNLPSFTTGANTITFNGSTNVIGASSASTMKNRVINGAFNVSQYNANNAVTNSSGSTYFVDRFLTYDGSGGSHFSLQQMTPTTSGYVTPPPGFVNYVSIKTTSAVSASGTNNFTFNQYIEGYTIGDLNWGTSSAQTCTLSFWVQSSLTGTFNGMLQSGNGDAFYIYTYNIPVANTWTFVSVTIPGPTIGTWLANTNGRALNLRWDLGMGSNFVGTAGSWSGTSAYTVNGVQKLVGTLNATLYLTGIQFEVGSTATSFDFRHYQQELALCQRYCYCVPGTTAGDRIGGGFIFSSTGGIFYVYFPVYMRASPTLLGTPSPIYLNDSTAAYATSAVTLNGSNVNFASFSATSSGMTAYRGCQAYFTSTQTNTLILTSEL